jgi:glycosyltransferase involved in cell wall biosynthesis
MYIKIALITNSVRGLLGFRKDLIKGLNEKGAIVLGFAPDILKNDIIKLKKFGVKPIKYLLKRSSVNPIFEVISIISLIKLIKKEKPGIVFCFQIKPTIYGSIAAILCRTEKIYVMIEGLGYLFTDNNLKTRIIRGITIGLFKIVITRVKKVFFLNQDDRKEFIKNRIIRPDKSIVLGGIGVDLDEWQYINKKESDISFIFIGRLLKAKGIMEFLRAAEIIKSRYPSTKFIVLGDVDSNPGSIKKEDILLYVKKGIIEWPGFVDVKPWLSKNSVFVLPSYYREGIPRSTQEAMAMGCPVITTNSIGCRETVLDGINGFIIPPKNIEDLIKAMEKFIINPSLIKEMGKESRKIAEIRFDSKKINKKVIDEIFN